MNEIKNELLEYLQNDINSVKTLTYKINSEIPNKKLNVYTFLDSRETYITEIYKNGLNLKIDILTYQDHLNTERDFITELHQSHTRISSVNRIERHAEKESYEFNENALKCFPPLSSTNVVCRLSQILPNISISHHSTQ
ncbi:27459_t:CDS:2, partial [Racocetra persica]